MRFSTTGFDLAALVRVFDDHSANVRSRIVAMYVLLAAGNAVVWILAVAAFASRPALLGTALLAYTFGLRHAVDADHISAIDNVTRKLIQENKRPVTVGFFFSLGHSTIVVALTAAIAVAASTAQRSFPSLEHLGGLVGTSISALFLYGIAALNFVALVEVFRAFRCVRDRRSYNAQSLDEFLMNRGLVGRFFRPLTRLVARSCHMYPLGVLFGLGFDTATEVGILGIAAIEAGKGLPIVTIVIFPLLFTAAMSLIDTSDGILMLGAYGWAFVKPIRKLYYNLNVTLVSVLVAVVVGTIELATMIGDRFKMAGTAGTVVGHLNENSGALGFAIVGVFVITWCVSLLIYKLRRYDELSVETLEGTA